MCISNLQWASLRLTGKLLVCSSVILLLALIIHHHKHYWERLSLKLPAGERKPRALTYLIINTSRESRIPFIPSLATVENFLETFKIYEDFFLNNHNSNATISGYLKPVVTGARGHLEPGVTRTSGHLEQVVTKNQSTDL